MDQLKMFEVESWIEEALLGADNDEDEFQELPKPKPLANNSNAYFANPSYVELPIQWKFPTLFWILKYKLTLSKKVYYYVDWYVQDRNNVFRWLLFALFTCAFLSSLLFILKSLMTFQNDFQSAHAERFD